jgi:homospermidine synthase
VILGYGAIATAALPRILARLSLPPGRVTVLDRADRRGALRDFIQRGVRFERVNLTRDNCEAVLRARLQPGDLLIDLASHIDTLQLLQACRERGVRFLNTSIECWLPGDGDGRRDERLLTTRMRRVEEWMAARGGAPGPTAVIDHGANPGIVSHFVRQGLADLAAAALERRLGPARLRAAAAEALAAGAWGRLAEALRVRAIQVCELDTQATARPRPESEFQSTWSASTMHEEALTPAELCWGTHEGAAPAGAHVFDDGAGHMVRLPGSGIETWVASWTPGGSFPAMVIGHDEAYTIGRSLTVATRGRVRYRPTVYFAYLPCEPTLDSLREAAANGDDEPRRTRVLTDDLDSGRDQLGCLLLGHPLGAWWIGSLLSVGEARAASGPGVNATTQQVSASLEAALAWLLENPAAGARFPEDLPHDAILPAALPLLGPFRSEPVAWTPNGSPPRGGAGWRFGHFLLDATLATASHPPFVARDAGIRTGASPAATGATSARAAAAGPASAGRARPAPPAPQ